MPSVSPTPRNSSPFLSSWILGLRLSPSVPGRARDTLGFPGPRALGGDAAGRPHRIGSLAQHRLPDTELFRAEMPPRPLCHRPCDSTHLCEPERLGKLAIDAEGHV